MRMTKQTIKELKTLLKVLNTDIKGDVNASFDYWIASKLIHEHLLNVYIYNSENKDMGYILYRKEVFKIFNDNLRYLFLSVNQKNINIPIFMRAYTKVWDNFMCLKSFLKDLQGEYITTTPKKRKQFAEVLACTNAFVLLIEKHIELLEERAKKL